MGELIQAIGIKTTYVSFILLNKITTDVSFHKTFYISDLFTNLIFFSMLLKKRYSFNIRTFYILNKSNWKLVYVLLKDNLFPFKIICKKAKHSKYTKINHLNPSQARIEYASNSCNLAFCDLKHFIECLLHSNLTPILGSD